MLTYLAANWHALIWPAVVLLLGMWATWAGNQHINGDKRDEG